MFYKKCNTCTNKTCLKTKKICKSMDRYLRDHVEVPQSEALLRDGNNVMRMHGMGESLKNECQ